MLRVTWDVINKELLTLELIGACCAIHKTFYEKLGSQPYEGTRWYVSSFSYLRAMKFAKIAGDIFR